jgi:hypothetical protein
MPRAESRAPGCLGVLNQPSQTLCTTILPRYHCVNQRISKPMNLSQVKMTEHPPTNCGLYAGNESFTTGLSTYGKR